MNRERAETYLRLLAEAEMRDALSPRAPGSADAPAVGAGAQVRQTGLGPGEHLLSQIAARLLATVPRHQAGPARRAQHRRKILAARPGVRPATSSTGRSAWTPLFPFLSGYATAAAGGTPLPRPTASPTAGRTAFSGVVGPAALASARSRCDWCRRWPGPRPGSRCWPMARQLRSGPGCRCAGVPAVTHSALIFTGGACTQMPLGRLPPILARLLEPSWHLPRACL